MTTLVVTLLVSTALVALVTSLAMRGYLAGQLDSKLGESLNRAVESTVHGVPPTPPQGSADDGDGDGGRSDGDDPPTRFARGQETGTLTVVYDSSDEIGGVVSSTGSPRRVSQSVLSADPRRARRRPGAHRRPAALGDYRVKTAQLPGGVVVAGLPTREVTGTIAKLVGWEVLLGLLVVVAAGLVGRSVVRRQLRPLRKVAATAHEVTELPLESGEIGETDPGARRPHRPAHRGRARSAPRSTRCSPTSRPRSTPGTAARRGCASSSPTPPTSCGPRSPPSAATPS